MDCIGPAAYISLVFLLLMLRLTQCILLRQCDSVVCVCVVIAVLTYDSRRMISLYESKLEFSLMTAVRFVYIAVDFEIRKYSTLTSSFVAVTEPCHVGAMPVDCTEVVCCCHWPRPARCLLGLNTTDVIVYSYHDALRCAVCYTDPLGGVDPLGCRPPDFRWHPLIWPNPDPL